MHTLHLHALDSRYATSDEIAAAGVHLEELPPDFRLMAHQAKTIHALRSGNASIIVNTAKTGDGKSFAGQYLSLIGERHSITMYPTNELAADQNRSLNQLKWKWQTGGMQQLHWETLNAPKLDSIQRAVQINRPEALNLLLNSDLLLTNPDVFHLMMQFRYRTQGAAADLVLGEIANRFNLFTFDEFHIFSTPQTLSVLISMLLLLETTGAEQSNLRFLFLSATPQQSLALLAELAGIPVVYIEGDYEHGRPEPSVDRRRILQRTQLYVHDRGDGIEAWIEANLEQIITFFKQNPGSRGIILVNSVATAYRVHRGLVDVCRQAGIRLGEPNTGLIPPEARKIDADLFVATSTVDLGVDFKINFLVFESIDAATHTQRLGRLGRHERNETDQPFIAYAAHALLPQWVVDAIKVKFPDQSEVNREDYAKAIDEAYSKPQEFKEYRYRWAGIQAGYVLATLESKEIRRTYADVRSQLNERYKALFPASHLYRSTIKKWLDETPMIFDEVSSFRGTTPFNVLVLNSFSREESILSYSLLPLLRDGILEALSLDEIYEQAGENSNLLKKSNPLAAYRLLGWLPKQPRRISVILNEPTLDWSAEYFETVIEQAHFRFEVEGRDVPNLYALNDELEQRTLVALLVRQADPDSLRWKYRLGLQLDLFPFRSQDGASIGTVAFGRHALLLDTFTHRQKPKIDDPMFG